MQNASFIGFTSTPIEKMDANTRAVFGDYLAMSSTGSILLRQQHRGHRPVPLGDDPDLGAAIRQVGGQEPVPIGKGTIVSGPVLRVNVSPIPSLVAMEPWKWQVGHSHLLSRAEFEDALFSQCRDDSVGQLRGYCISLALTNRARQPFFLSPSTPTWISRWQLGQTAATASG